MSSTTKKLKEKAKNSSGFHRKKFWHDVYGRKLLNFTDINIEIGREIGSRGTALVFAIFGVIVQAIHNYYIADSLALLEPGPLRTISTILLAIFVSGALLYFTVSNDEKGSNNEIIRRFYSFEVLANIYYYLSKIIYHPLFIEDLGYADIEYNKLVMSIAIAFFVPWIIKAYALRLNVGTVAPALNDDAFVQVSELLEYRKELDRYFELASKYKANFDAKLASTENTLLQYEESFRINAIEASDNIEKTVLQLIEKKLSNIPDEFDIFDRLHLLATSQDTLFNKITEIENSVETIINAASIEDPNGFSAKINDNKEALSDNMKQIEALKTAVSKQKAATDSLVELFGDNNSEAITTEKAYILRRADGSGVPAEIKLFSKK